MVHIVTTEGLTMRTSAQGIALIKSFEGCLSPIGAGRFKPYYCPAGVLTIGWGHTNDGGGRPFNVSAVWTQAECDQALREDLVRYEQMVLRQVTVDLAQGQFDALVSFTYNCGEGNLERSTLLKRVNARDWDGAAAQFSAWNRAGGKVLAGLTRRRAAEAEMFRRGSVDIAGDVAETGPMPQRVDVPSHQDAPAALPVPAPGPSATGFFSRLRNWVVAGGTSLGFTGLGTLTDWKVAVALFVFVLIATSGSIGFVIWFFGAEPVREWVRRHVA